MENESLDIDSSVKRRKMENGSLDIDSSVKQIYLWCNARSLGTVFLKCLSHIEDVQIINGLFTTCFLFGPDGTLPKSSCEHILTDTSTFVNELPNSYDGSKHGPSWVKTQFDVKEFPGKKVLIYKDQPYTLNGQAELLPQGMQHTFLIRHPYRMFPSFSKTYSKYFPKESFEEMLERYHTNHFYKTQYKLWQDLKIDDSADTASTPIIIDADDLQRHPESILRQYCHMLGIPFTPSLIHWKLGSDVVKEWKISRQLLGGGWKESGYFKKAMESTRLLLPGDMPKKEELDDEVRSCADKAMVYYEKMFQMRIKP